MIRLLIGLSVLVAILAIALPIQGAILSALLQNAEDAWYLERPEFEKAYICKKLKNRACDSSWSSFQHHCYRAFGQPLPRREAGTSCQTMNSSLVSIHGDAENLLVSSLCEALGDPDPAVRGAERGACWIGLARSAATSDVWSWDDGSDMNYSHFARARMLVGDFIGVTMNGDWRLVTGHFGEFMTIICMLVNVLVTFGSTAILIYTVRRQDAGCFMGVLKIECICAGLCLLSIIPTLMNLSKDPEHLQPQVALAGFQILAMSLMLPIQYFFEGSKPKFDTLRSPVPHVRTSATHVQPQSIPRGEP